MMNDTPWLLNTATEECFPVASEAEMSEGEVERELGDIGDGLDAVPESIEVR